jgi:hypothetical protein
MSLYGGKQMSGGSGLQYAASTIIYLSKSKEKDGTEVIGNIIRAKTQKSRLSKENQEVQIRCSMMNEVLIGTMVFLNLVNWVECGRMLPDDMRLMARNFMPKTS